MLNKMDIHDCLIFLENQGVTKAEINERLDLHRTTINNWWKTNNTNPEYLGKMRKWCGEFIPIEDHFYGKKPPKNIFHEAVTNAYYTLHSQIDFKDDFKNMTCPLYQYFKRNRIAIFLRCMEIPHFYARGCPPSRTKRPKAGHSYYGDKMPSIEEIYRIIADYHPLKRFRDYFTKLIDESP